MSLAKSIAQALGSAKSTTDGWLCVCPCHDDSPKSPSLSIKDTADGCIIVKCFAGCDWLDVKKELESRGLLDFSRYKSKHRPENKGEASSKHGEIIRQHIYRDQDGQYVFEKIKYSDGATFSRVKLPDGKYKWNIKDIEKPLYNLPNIIRAVANKETIYITEGEKDADSLVGLPATTSSASTSWPDKYSQILAGAKSVVIFRDNDAPGLDIAKKRLKAILPAVPDTKIVTLPTEYNDKPIKDVADYLNAGATIDELLAIVAATESPKPKGKKDSASRQDYIDEIVKFFNGDVRRCIFSDDLCYFDKHSNLWIPAANKLKALRSEIKEISRAGVLQFKANDIEDNFYYLENSEKPQFVVSVPEWDGIDRIASLADRIILKPMPESSMIDSNCFQELLKYWHCKMWQRLVDPTIRNEIFILSGPQNIGKDFWIRENCDALGQYLINFSIHSNERDTKEQLHRGLVMNISEFDRTSRSEVSLLKEIVTATQTDLRFAYDRRAMTRACRCSFIASTNVNDIFNDPTGHSRYVFFEIDDIKRNEKFSAEDKLQVLSQGRALAESGYMPSGFSLAAMADQIDEHTPDDEYQTILEQFDYEASKIFMTMGPVDKQTFGQMKGDSEFTGFIPMHLCDDLIIKLSRSFDKSNKKIRSTLKNNRRQRKDPNHGRGFYFKYHIPSYPEQDYEF